MDVMGCSMGEAFGWCFASVVCVYVVVSSNTAVTDVWCRQRNPIKMVVAEIQTDAV